MGAINTKETGGGQQDVLTWELGGGTVSPLWTRGPGPEGIRRGEPLGPSQAVRVSSNAGGHQAAGLTWSGGSYLFPLQQQLSTCTPWASQGPLVSFEGSLMSKLVS